MSDPSVYAKTYWSGKGEYQKLYDSLHKKLVPDNGEADTEAGELLRLASNIYHDVYNNGGCNFADKDGGRRGQFDELREIVRTFGCSDSAFSAMLQYAEGDLDIAELVKPLESLIDFCILKAANLTGSIIYYYRGQIERGADYHWTDGWSENSPEGQPYYPWNTKRECQSAAKKAGARAVFVRDR
jgi:hypothetical protein